MNSEPDSQGVAFNNIHNQLSNTNNTNQWLLHHQDMDMLATMLPKDCTPGNTTGVSNIDETIFNKHFFNNKILNVEDVNQIVQNNR